MELDCEPNGIKCPVDVLGFFQTRSCDPPGFLPLVYLEELWEWPVDLRVGIKPSTKADGMKEPDEVFSLALVS